MGAHAFAAVEDFDDDTETTPHRDIPEYECPMCTGTGEFMGGMAHREWFRCRACAIDYSRTVERTS